MAQDTVRTRARRQGVPLESIPAYSSFHGGQVGAVYNEAAFRHFLTVDRRRASRSARSVLLILVTVRRRPGATLTLAEATALFRELGAAVREADFVGWYREGSVAAAVLAQSVRASSEVPRLVANRVLLALKSRLSADLSRDLRVRAVRLGAPLGEA